MFSHDSLEFDFYCCSRRVKACSDNRTCLSRSLVSGSIKFPSLSNFGGGWNAWTNSSGLLMKWRSKKTPTWRRWYWARPPPKFPPALTTAAGLSAQQFGARDAQSIAFFRGPTSIIKKKRFTTKYEQRCMHLIFKAGFKVSDWASLLR